LGNDAVVQRQLLNDFHLSMHEEGGLMALSDELAYLTATELAIRIRRRQLSAVEVVDAFIERIEQRNKSLNAFVYLGFEDARKRAKEAEQALLAGAALGPLHGVPTAMKD
jgi:amidase